MGDWPAYDQLVQKNYRMIDGYHTLGMIGAHRPDIQLIGLWGHTIEDKNFDWLEQSIDQALAAGLKVAVIVWDEIGRAHV